MAGGQKFLPPDPLPFCPSAMAASWASRRFLEKKKGKCPCLTRPVRGHLKLKSQKFSLNYQNNFVL
jgi:hypothetical protein